MKSSLCSERAINKSHSLDEELEYAPPPADVRFPLIERLGGELLASRRNVALLVRTTNALLDSRYEQASIDRIFPSSISPHLLASIACAEHAFETATATRNAH